MSNLRTVLMAIVLLACRMAHGQAAISTDSAAPSPADAGAEIVVPLTRDTAPPPVIAPRAQVIRGNDRVIAPPKNLGVPVGGQASAFRFEDAPLVDVVHIILRDILKVDYVIHSQLPGNITLATRGDVSGDQAAYLLESALQANGVAMARDTRGVYHVGRPEALQGIVASPRLAGSGVLPPGTGTVIVPLQYIGAPEMATILRPLLPANAIVRVDPVRNLLILAGTRIQAEGWLDLVATFDVDLLKGMSVGVFPLKYASVREVETALRMMSGGAPAAAATAPRPPGAPAVPAAQGGAAGAALLENPLLGAIRVMPLERINSLLIVAPRAAYLDEARIWIEKLDRPGNSASEPQLHIYPVKNGSAAHLATVLNGIFGEGGGGGGGVQRTGPNVAPGLTTATGATVATGGAGGLQGLSGAGQLGTSQLRAPTTTTIQGARVMADELNNAVLVYSLPSEYVKIEATLRRLDLPPTQVLIEASIIEVTLGDELQYGLQWFFTDKARGGLTGTGVFSQRDGGVLGGAVHGFSYTLRSSVGDVRAVLNLLADKSLVKVISSPSLMVLDNHTAAIAVGNQQPIRSTETVTTGGNVSTSIQYKDTGVNLQVTPSVSAENMVTMQINQAVTDVGGVDVPTGQRSFLQRQIASKVAVRSGETLVLGGLIRDNDTTGRSGLPIISGIPVIGALFGSHTRSFARTELLVIITPRVVRSDTDIRDVGNELRERMKSFPGNDMLRRP